MNKTKLKKICSIILILVGTILLVLELASSTKNYYVQAIGIVCLMSGVFTVNTNVSSKLREKDTIISKTLEEEE